MTSIRLIARFVITATTIILVGTAMIARGEATKYTDPKGYYTLTPPTGWSRKDFSTDPRSKVQFFSPDGAAQLGIIVRPESESYEEILAGAKQNAENQKRNFPSGTFTIMEATVCGCKAVKVENSVPGMVRQDLYLFPSGGLHFNIAYGAPSQSLFDKFKDDAQAVINSLHPRGAKIQSTSVEIQQGRDASSVRQVQIAFNLSGISEGIAAVEELTSQEPQNKMAADLLLELKKISDNRVVFIQQYGGQKIYTANLDGSNEKCLTSDSSNEDMPMFSPDGRYIVFRSERNGNQDIWKMDYDGSNPVQLTDNPDKDSEPSWSPDGQRIIYASKKDGAWSLWSMKADGTDKCKLVDNAGGGSLSPDGKLLVFSRGKPIQIWFAKADGSDPQEITTGLAINASPVWTPDGNKIAFISNRDGNIAVYIMDKDGKNQVKLTKGAGNNGGRVSFSPDSRWISFSSDRDGHMQLYIMAMDGTMETKILQSPNDTLTAHMGRCDDR